MDNPQGSRRLQCSTDSSSTRSAVMAELIIEPEAEAELEEAGHRCERSVRARARAPARDSSHTCSFIAATTAGNSDFGGVSRTLLAAANAAARPRAG